MGQEIKRRATSVYGRARLALLLTALLSSVASLALIGPCSQAWANGVHFDPESPASKEYGLPLPEARNEALGGTRTGHASFEPPLFGIGIPGGRHPPAGLAKIGHLALTKGLARQRSRLTGVPARGSRRGAARAAAETRLSEAHPYSLADGVGITAGLILASAVLGWALRLGTRNSFRWERPS